MTLVCIAELNKSKILNRQTSFDLISILLQITQIKLIFDSSENGIKLTKFHQHCNGIMRTLTIAKTKRAMVAGGYTDKEWNGHRVFKDSNETFLFSLKLQKNIQN